MPPIEIVKKVEIVTPAFPGGADNKPQTANHDIDRDGIRTSAIIYGLRWWFRALAGSIRGTSDLDNIRLAESALFGTSQSIWLGGEKFDGLASRIRVAISENINPNTDLELFDDHPLWLKYLAYGLFPTDRRKDDFTRRLVKPGAKFEFHLRVGAPREKVEPVITRELIESLTDLWIELGGLGGRWRHGLGGMRLADAAPIAKPIEYPAQLRRRIATALGHVETYLASLQLKDPSTVVDGLPGFPICKDPYFKIAWRAQAGIEPYGALENVKKIWRGTRQIQRGNERSSSRNAPLYRAVRENEDTTGKFAEFAGLGLPIPFGFPKIDRFTAAIEPLDESIQRRASPIWFRVIKVNDKQYGLLALLWDCVYLPDSAREVMVGDKQVTFNPREAVEWFDQLIKSPADRFVRG